MLYGKDWKKMQPLIKSRSLVQIRTHAQKVFKKIGLKKALMGHVARRGKTGDSGDTSGGTGGPAAMGQVRSTHSNTVHCIFLCPLSAE
jgi:hypothetical protein